METNQNQASNYKRYVDRYIVGQWGYHDLVLWGYDELMDIFKVNNGVYNAYWLALSHIDLMHSRHRAAMLGAEAIALYTLVICCWHIADNCVYA